MLSVTVTLGNFSFNLSRNFILTCREMSMHVLRFSFWPKPLQKVEISSTLSNGECNKNTASHVHFRACYMKQRSVRLGWQRRNEFVRQVVRKIA